MSHEKRLRDTLAALKGPNRETVEYLGDLATDAIRAAREEGRKEGRAEGFAAAREMAAGECANVYREHRRTGSYPMDMGGLAKECEQRIRAMQDGRAGGEGCTACGHVFHDDNKCPGCTANGTQCIRDDS